VSHRSRPVAIALLAVLCCAEVSGLTLSDLGPVGYHPGAVAYYTVPYFANALHQGEEWLSYRGSEFGTPADLTTAQFDADGYPQFLKADEKLRAIVYGLNTNYFFRPASWPRRDRLARGHVVLTWRGNADIRLTSCRFAAGESSGGPTGALVDGRRSYLCTDADQSTETVEVHAIVTPVREIRVWLATPDDPGTPVDESLSTSLEGRLFHPLLVRRLSDAPWGFIRFMDWGATNSSPQRDWSDRRRPSHAFMTGVLNPRSPAEGFPGGRGTGVAYEYMVQLCNATGKNLWINVPHLATADYVTKLAQLIRYGSDGLNPYDRAVATPAYAALDPGLKVYVEYSNEIWSSGNEFAQGEWARQQADALGLPVARFNARQFCDVWRRFQQVFGGADRLVRVAATFTADEVYTESLIREMGAYGASSSPVVQPDVLAVTTYFGNGIQDFVNEQGFARNKLYDDPYWSSAQLTSDLNAALSEWKRRILSGDATQGGGPDSNGPGGGFSSAIHDLAGSTLGYRLPVIAYEGGPSLYTDYLDGAATNSNGVPIDDEVTTFLEALNRSSGIQDIYRIQLNLALSKGLWTHTPYVDAGPWSKFGQWGHLETLDQAPEASPKYSFLLEWSREAASIRSIDLPSKSVPIFETAASLPPALIDAPYQSDIVASGGDGARTVRIVSTLMGRGLSAGAVAGDPNRIRVSGTLTAADSSWVFARVSDSDGDAAWRIFTIEAVGGRNTLVQSDFRGTSPSLASPWSKAHVLSPLITFGGWSIGAPILDSAGVRPEAGDDGFVFSVDSAGEKEESLSRAIADRQYLKCSITPVGQSLDLRGAEVRFTVRRIGFWSPRSYAVFTSLSGFREANVLFSSRALDHGDFAASEFTFTLPAAAAAYSAVSSTVEFRIYAAGAAFEGHKTSLTGFKLTQRSAP
jgi:hypothetical protein